MRSLVVLFILAVQCLAWSQVASSSFMTTVQMGYSSALYDQQDGHRSQSYDFLLSPSYKVSEHYTLGAVLAGGTDANQVDGSDFGRGDISISHSPMNFIADTGRLWNFTPSFAVGFPVSKMARDDQSLLVSLKPGIQIAPSSDLLGTHRLTPALGIGFSRNFHSYTTSQSGYSNSEYGAFQSLSVGFSFTKKISIQAEVDHYNTWTYQGVPNELWGHSEEFDYNFSKTFTWATGHVFGNPAVGIYKADGQTLNLGLVAEQYSNFYTNLTASF
jgi:hypothetical protein